MLFFALALHTSSLLHKQQVFPQTLFTLVESLTVCLHSEIYVREWWQVFLSYCFFFFFNFCTRSTHLFSERCLIFLGKFTRAFLFPESPFPLPRPPGHWPCLVALLSFNSKLWYLCSWHSCLNWGNCFLKDGFPCFLGFFLELLPQFKHFGFQTPVSSFIYLQLKYR